MRTTKAKEEVVKTTEMKPEDFKEVEKKDLVEVFTLWLNTSKAGMNYLKGHIKPDESENKKYIVGFFNSNKKNPKEPDIRIYSVDAEGNQDIEIASLWETISKSGNRYLSGTTNDDEKLIGFYSNTLDDNKRPYINVYYK